MGLIPTKRVSASGCYYMANNTVYSSPGGVVPCGASNSPTIFNSCCNAEAGEVCLSDSVCYRPNNLGPMYYLSSCTDPRYTAPDCPQYCSMSDALMVYYPLQSPANLYYSGNQGDGGEHQIIYNSESQLWYCCGTKLDGSIDCLNSTAESFSAPPPGGLTVLHAASATSAPYLSSTFLTISSSISGYPLLTASTISPASSLRVTSSSSSLITGNIATPSALSSAASESGQSGLSEDKKIFIGLNVVSVIIATIGLYVAYRTCASKNRRANKQARRRGQRNNPQQGRQHSRWSTAWIHIPIRWGRQQEQEPVAQGLGLVF